MTSRCCPNGRVPARTAGRPTNYQPNDVITLSCFYSLSLLHLGLDSEDVPLVELRTLYSEDVLLVELRTLYLLNWQVRVTVGVWGLLL